MADPQAAVEFLRAVAAGILKETDPAEAAARARGGLERVLAEQKSFVVDVQFTGFAQKGALVGGVDPRLLRAAGQLIMSRVSRVGFTADAAEGDLATLFGLASRAPGELGGEGIVGALRAAEVRGVYLSTAAGETYRPPAPPKPAAEPEPPAPPAETPPRAAEAEAPAETPPPAETPSPAPPEAAPPPAEEPDAGIQPLPPAYEVRRDRDPQPHVDVLGFELLGDEVNFNDFEILEAFPDMAAEEGEPAPAAAGAAAPPPPRREEPAEGDLFHFFRAAGHVAEPEPGQIPAMLAAAGTMAAFDEAAAAAARAAHRLVMAGDYERAVEMLDTLAREAQRPDRSRLFRDAAVGALRKVGSDGTLHYLVDLLHQGGAAVRERVLRVVSFVGGDATLLLEGLLFRTVDADLRRAVFAALAGVEGMLPRLQTRTMTDPSPVRTRALLEVAATGALPADAALKWVAEAAGHADPSVRGDAARHAAALGGRGGLRTLVDLLGDAAPAVRRLAVDGLGGMGDPTAVPFLARVVADADDEDLQVAAIAALGRTASSEAVPALLGVLNRRQLFGGKKLLRAKTAALTALGRIPTPAAREVLHSVANGKDSDLAPEARRILAALEG